MRLFLLPFCALLSTTATAQDTLAPASLRYERPGLIRRIFIGGNYRKTWETPVRVPLFQIAKTNGGYTAKKLGGGQQTKSLQIVDKSGNEFVLRTVDKTVKKALEAKKIKSKFIANITQDMISAANPYGALAVPPIARAVGVISTEPKLYYIRNSGVPGEYQSIFSGQMVLLEKRKPTLLPGDKLHDTKELLKDLEKGKKAIRLDLPMLLQARLVDMLIGDWDRHGGQWQWGYRKTGDATYVYPVPEDHDQAFFHSNGTLVTLVRPFTMKHLVGFKPSLRRIRKLNRKEWDFDKVFIGQLSKAEWEAGILYFQEKVTDSVLREAVAQMPGETTSFSGQKLFQKLQGRRNTMLRDGLRYQHYLEKRPLPKLQEHAEEAREEKTPAD